MFIEAAGNEADEAKLTLSQKLSTTWEHIKLYWHPLASAPALRGRGIAASGDAWSSGRMGSRLDKKCRRIPSRRFRRGCDVVIDETQARRVIGGKRCHN